MLRTIQKWPTTWSEKIKISNLKDIANNNLSPRVYDLDEFDDQVKLYRQHVAYISNSSSAKSFLDFSNNKEYKKRRINRNFFQTKFLKGCT